MIDPERYDWSTFEIVFYYDESVSDVFRAWTSPEGLEAFFVERARFTSPRGIERAPADTVETGDEFEWAWRQALELKGRVTNLVQDREFSFTFGAMNVSVFFRAVGRQTELHLVQSSIPNTPEGRVAGHLNCRSCWVFFLTNLKSVLPGGPDLRDADPDRVSSIEVGFVPLSHRT
ncbi:MAG: SRPBCC family protein [Planctomycetota bacterium]|jgi:uncharacterized protein YndB with AHSA1/START domain